MNDVVASVVAYALSAIALWLFTRRSKRGYIRWQWRRPHWILLRLAVVILVLHGAFVSIGVPTLVGYGAVALLTLVLLLPGEALTALLGGGVGFVVWQWLFWLPSRRELVLRSPKPSTPPDRPQLVGLEGVAETDLKPAGTIAVQGSRRAARAGLGYIRKGEPVVIDSVGDFEVTVSKIHHHPASSADTQPAPPCRKAAPAPATRPTNGRR